MLKEENLRRQDGGVYEEPEGEFLELMSVNSNTVDVLTRVESDNARVESSPVDPTELTVSELESALEDEDYDWNDAALRGLIASERDGDNRVTAIKMIEEKLQ